MQYECIECGSSFTREPKYKEIPKCCSQPCAIRYASRCRRYHTEGIKTTDIICAHCGKQRAIPSSQVACGKQHYCSEPCRAKGVGNRRRGLTLNWEVDWTKRSVASGQLRVWARNVTSVQPAAREWHWTPSTTLRSVGIKWQLKAIKPFTLVNGYRWVHRNLLSDEDIAVVDKYNLWVGSLRHTVPEHRLVAAKHYGDLIIGKMIRHLNGDKTDNRPENLLPGTPAENIADHSTARKLAIYWRLKCEATERELAQVRRQLQSNENKQQRQLFTRNKASVEIPIDGDIYLGALLH